LSFAGLTLFVACALAPSTSRAAGVRVPGTRVTLAPPPGFILADRYPGFQRADKAASIIITELPGPAKEMQKGMTADLLATRGMNLIRSQTVKVGGQDALLVHVSQITTAMEFLKWMLVAGDEKLTVMIVGMFPRTATELSQPIKQAVLSASWGSGVHAPPFEGLAFRVDPTPKLRLAGRVGNALVLTESGTMGPSESDQAILVIGSSLSDASIGNIEEFARERATKSTQVGPLRNVVGHGITTDGLPGYELVAEADDLKTGRAVRMYQLVLLDGKTYYLAQGFVAAARPPEIIDQYRQVTGSFRRNRARTGGPAKP
jgi:hypothetical protein